jgi:hypothetical protein
MSDVQTIERLSDLERALDHPEEQVRLQVAKLIANNPEHARALRSGSRDVVDALCERVSRETRSAFRIAMLTALSALGSDPRTVATMTHEAQTAHGTFEHMLSLYYLAEHDAENARPFARRLLFSDHRDQVRIAATLLSDASDITPQERVRMLCVIPTQATHDWSPAHVQALVRELSGAFQAGAQEIVLEHHPELAEKLLPHWESLEVSTQIWLTRHAVLFPNAVAAGNIIRHALKAPVAELRLSALRHLVAHGMDLFGIGPADLRPLMTIDDEHAALVTRLASDFDELVNVASQSGASINLRCAAIATLARQHANAVEPQLLRALLDDPSWKVRSAASDVLAHRSDLGSWVETQWDTLSERAQLALARAALEQQSAEVLEMKFAEVAFA